MDQAHVDLIKAAVALAAVVLVAVLARRGGGRASTVVAGLLAAVSAAAYIRFGNFHWPAFLHNWDLYHYYIGSKYFAELGYYDLYRCTLEADTELDGELTAVTRVRDLRTLRFVSPEELLAERPSCRETFGPSRWEELKRDLAFFHRITPVRTWRAILIDKGYNGSPPWTRYAGALASWARTDEPWRLTLVAALDEVLLVLMLLGVLWAFGPRAFLIGTIFLGVNFANRFQHVGGSMLRMDWLATLVLALCALRKDRHALAGLLLSHAVAARVFPILFVAGVLMRAALVLWRERRVDRGAARLVAGLGAGLVLFGLLGATGPRGPAAWGQFAENIAAHSSAPAGKRIGLKYVILPLGRLEVGGTGETDEVNDAFRQRWEDRRPIALALAVLALAVMWAGVRRLDDVEAFALGVVPVFFLLSPTRYYWAMLVVPVVVWAAMARKWQPEALATLLLMQVVLFLMNRFAPGSMALSAVSSWCLLVILGYVLWSLVESDLRGLQARWRAGSGDAPRDPGG